MSQMVRQSMVVLGLVTCLLLPGLALAHAFPVKSAPKVGATVNAAPKQVRVWFDGDLSAPFSKLTVTNGAGQPVTAGPSRVAAKDSRLLEVKLKPLAPGQYWAHWSVVAQDGHHTEGKFPFSVK